MTGINAILRKVSATGWESHLPHPHPEKRKVRLGAEVIARLDTGGQGEAFEILEVVEDAAEGLEPPLLLGVGVAPALELYPARLAIFDLTLATSSVTLSQRRPSAMRSKPHRIRCKRWHSAPLAYEQYVKNAALPIRLGNGSENRVLSSWRRG